MYKNQNQKINLITVVERNHIKKTKGKATKINTKEMGIKTTIPIKKTTLVEIGLKKIITETTVAATVNPILNLMGS